MKIQAISSENNNKVQKSDRQHQRTYTPSFKSAGAGVNGALNFFGNIMQGIENGGFLVSFLIQDALGMTAPRVFAAFLRDKEVTGQYNMQEGFEVLGREGLTGPCMMAVAPISFALAAKFGKSTGVNSRLIKRFGNSLREIVSNPNFDKELLKNKDKFKQEFYRINIADMLKKTLGEEHATEKNISFIMGKIAKYENPVESDLTKNFLGMPKRSKYKQEQLNEIVKYINDIKYSTSHDLGMLDKVKVGSEKLNDTKEFATRNAIEAMIKYSDDAIALNSNLSKLDANMAEDIKNASLAKRFITNISTIAATLGILSFLPKLYIRSNISPGARTAMQLKEAKNTENVADNQAVKDIQNNNEVSFKGKKPNNSFLAKIGKKLAKYLDKDFIASELEYNGHNFTNSLMAGLSLFGLLTPRGLKAYRRAQVDEDGKKDLTEVYEILIRDISSSLSVVFAVPMLTRAAVTSYENKSGFVLMHKDRSKSKMAQQLDLLNPYSKAHVLTNSEINSLYNNVDSIDKMLNFCKYIDENGGDLQKILSKSENAGELFNKSTFDLSEITNMTKQDKNKKIMNFFEELSKKEGTNKSELNKTISNLMKGTAGKPKANKILGFARGLNSVPGVITTFLIAPWLLGWFIPRLTYANTRRIHENAEKERQAKSTKINTAA